MVAIIKGSSNVSRTLNYNEHKCREGRAALIYASGFIKDAAEINFYDKINRFNMQNELNERTKINTLHVSLNFDPTERLSNETLCEIAQSYMQQIGFGDQPYLVYRHDDTGHPHMHIVSTNIQADGSAISLHKIGKNKSEPARKAIEKTFNLIKAESRRRTINRRTEPVSLIYGQSPLKQTISNILTAVIGEYAFTTLGELNAVLQLFNVTAERGEKHSRMYSKRGLVFRALDSSGKPAGPAIKASRFYMKPTLSQLEKHFEKNRSIREPHKRVVRQKLEQSFADKPQHIEQWKARLRQQNIDAVIRKTAEGNIYGITYIDHYTKTVFNGSAFGKSYSAGEVEEYFANTVSSTEYQQKSPSQQELEIQSKHDNELLNILTQSEFTPDQLPWHLRRKRRKRKGRRT